MSDPSIDESVTMAVRDGVSMIQLAARRGMDAEIDVKARFVFGLGLPSSPRAVENDGKTIVWSGPGQWLVVQDPADGTDLAGDMKQSFRGLASVVDVSDSRVMLEVAGPSARQALSGILPVDLHDRTFPPGNVAITQGFHLGVTLWRAASGQSFTLLCARTYAGDFLRHLGHALGVAVTHA